MIHIRLPSSTEELVLAQEFLQKIYNENFKTYPKELPHYFFIAFDLNKGNKIVGTINIQLKRDDLLETETYFDFDTKKHFPNSKVGEIGRFTSVHSGLSTQLIATVLLFAKQFSLDYLVSFNKPYVTKIIHKVLGKEPTVHTPRLRKDAIPQQYANFFLDERYPVSVLSLRVKDFLNKLPELLQKGKGEFEIEIPKNLLEYDSQILHPLSKLGNNWK